MTVMSRNSVYVQKPDQLPKGEHWAIIEGSSVSVPGDERSRTAPGHGYPEHTDYHITYHAFTDKQEFETELARQLESNTRWGYGRSVVGIHVSGVYQPTTHVELTEAK
jgi:hypothetical protein